MTLKNNTKTILKEKIGKRQPIKTNKQKRYFFYKRKEGIPLITMMQLQEMHLAYSLKQLENWKEYINQVFSDIGQWI